MFVVGCRVDLRIGNLGLRCPLVGCLGHEDCREVDRDPFLLGFPDSEEGRGARGMSQRGGPLMYHITPQPWTTQTHFPDDGAAREHKIRGNVDVFGIYMYGSGSTKLGGGCRDCPWNGSKPAQQV